MAKNIIFTTRTKEKNPTKDPEIQVNSIAITAGRLIVSLIKEGKIQIGVEARVSLDLKTSYSGDIMENIVSLRIESIDGTDIYV